MAAAPSPSAESLEERLGHRFGRRALLEQALTHSSFGADNNERLEFLGDSLLGCAISHALFARFPDIPEGQLTRLKAALVRREAVAEVGRLLGIENHLRLAEKANATTAVIADAVEALFGAVFMDAGYEVGAAVVIEAYRPLMEGLDPATSFKDAKSELQELLQAMGDKPPLYEIVRTVGKGHELQYEVKCEIPAMGLQAFGQGTSTQRAQQEAARAMLQKPALRKRRK